MNYREMLSTYAEDKEIYNRTGSLFHLRRYKLLALGIKDAILNNHSDCTDKDLKVIDYENTRLG